MFDLITIARPYAKAAFDFAVKHQSIEHWHQMLAFAAAVARNEQMIDLISGALAPNALAALFNAICGDQLNKPGQNLIKVMAENRRLTAMQAVLFHFIQLRDAYEATVEVDLISAGMLSEKQMISIRAAMEKRFLRTVKLNCKIDKSLIGGMIIRADNLVIDGSVRNRLDRLADVLQS